MSTDRADDLMTTWAAVLARSVDWEPQGAAQGRLRSERRYCRGESRNDSIRHATSSGRS
jgi:hypothetical protein